MAFALGVSQRVYSWGCRWGSRALCGLSLTFTVHLGPLGNAIAQGRGLFEEGSFGFFLGGLGLGV